MDRIESWEILDLLQSLVDKSLVVYEAEANGQGRYRLLETVRHYSLDRLREAGQGDSSRTRHRDYYLELAQIGVAELFGPEQARWLGRLEAEHDNLRAALDFCQNHPNSAEAELGLLRALQPFWAKHGYLSEGRQRSVAALAREEAREPTARRATVLNGVANLARMQGDYDPARACLEKSLAIRRTLGDTQGIAVSLGNLGNIAKDQGDYAAARQLYQEALTLHRAIGNRRDEAVCLGNLGNVALDQGDYDTAAMCYQESLEIQRVLRDTSGIAGALTNLGNVALAHDDYRRAAACYREALALRREIGDQVGLATTLVNLGHLACQKGDYAGARVSLAECLTLRRTLGDRLGIAYALADPTPSASDSA